MLNFKSELQSTCKVIVRDTCLETRIKSFIKLVTGSCTEACTVLSSGTASPYSRSSSSSSSLLVPNSSCTCQCNFDLPIFREDLHICVNDIHGKVQRLVVDEMKKARVIARTLTISDFRYFLLVSWSKSSGKSAQTVDLSA